MVTRADQQEVLIWTDGSKIHNRVDNGVYFGRNSNLTWQVGPNLRQLRATSHTKSTGALCRPSKYTYHYRK